MTMETKQLHALSKIYQEAVYGGAKKEAPKDSRLVVTAADKKAISVKQLDPQKKRDSRTELLTVSVSLDTGKIVGIVAVGILASAFLVSAMVFISG